MTTPATSFSGTAVRLLGLPSPPATNSDTSAGSTRVRQKEVRNMNMGDLDRGEITPPDEGEYRMEDEATPRAEGREWIEEKVPLLERTLSFKSRSEDVLERMKSLRLSRSTASTPAPEDPSSPPASAHTLARMRSASFTSTYDDDPAPVSISLSRQPSISRSQRADLALSSSISGSETEREPLSRRTSILNTSHQPAAATYMNGAGHEDDDTIHARHSRAYTAPRRQSVEVGQRSMSAFGVSGSAGSGSGSGGGTTRAKVSPKVRKGLPVEFRQGSEAGASSLPVSPEATVTPPTLSRNTSYASTSTMRRREREISFTSSDASSPSGSRGAAVRRSVTSYSEVASTLDDSPSSRTVIITDDRSAIPTRTTSLRRPRALPPLSARKAEDSPLSASALSPRTPGGSRTRTLVGEGLRAAGITSRRRLSDPPEEAAPVYAARTRFDSSTREAYTPLASRLTERERDRAPLSAPRASTSMSGSWRDRERQRERELMRTDPMPSRATMRRQGQVPDRSQTTIPFDRPASVADWRAPTPDQDRLDEPEHVRILWEALSTFGTNLGRADGSDDGSAIGSGESRSSVTGVGAVVSSAKSAVGAVSGLGNSVRRGVARGMQRVVQAELDDEGIGGDEEVERWKEELKEWRRAGKEVDEVVRALTGLMLGMGRVLRDAGLGEGSLVSRRSVDGAAGRRWIGSDGDGVITERERRPALPSLQAQDTPPPSSRLGLRKRATMAHPTPAAHAHHASLEYESPSPLARHTSLRVRQPPRPQMPSLASESNIPRPGTLRGTERKVSSASTASNSTLRGAPSSSSPATGPGTPLTPGGSSRSLKDRLTNFPPLLSSSRPTTSIDTTPASASASPYAFSAASLTPHITATPSLPRGRRGSMRDNLQGLFTAVSKPNGDREGGGLTRRESIRSRVEEPDEVDIDAETEDEQERRSRRAGRYFGN